MAARLDTLVDDFDDNTIDTTKWSANFGTVSETGGRARVTCDTGFAAYQSAAAYQLAGSSVSARIYPPAVGGGTGMFAQVLVITTTSGTDAGFSVNPDLGQLQMFVRVGFADSSQLNLPYSATNHAYVRLRETSGTLYWETSPDGAAWVTRRASPSPAWAINTNLQLQLLAHRASGTNDFAEFDDVSVAPVVAGAFPATPRQLAAEMYLNGAWVDVSTDVLDERGADIDRVRRDESSRPDPTRVAVNLLNNTGNYSPRNPSGIYWGSLGLNTPIRLAINREADTFTRTVSNGWGSTDTGQAWTVNDGASFGGTVQASDWSVTAGVGKHSVPVAAAARCSYLATLGYRDIDLRVDVSLTFTDVTGGAVEPANIMLAGLSTSNYYMVRMRIETNESITLQLQHADGTIIASQITVAGLTHSSAQTLRVRANLENQTIRAKVWSASGVEPYAWQIAGHASNLGAFGWVGIRSGVATGNSNTKPIVFSYDQLQLRMMRASVELSDLRVRWDETGNKCWSEIVAQGVRRRLGQGNSPLSSTLYRGITTLSPAAVAYWPCEDSASAITIGSALPSGLPMTVSGTTTFASYTGLPASEPLPVLNAAYWDGLIQAYTPQSPAKIQLRFVAAFPNSPEVPNLSYMIDIHNTGSAGLWRIIYNTGGSLSMEVWSNAFSGGPDVASIGAIGYNVKGKRELISLELTQNGANVDWTLATYEPLAPTALLGTGTVNNKTISMATRVFVDPLKVCSGLTIGHISVWPSVTTIFNLFSEINAFVGEKAGARLQRLCAQIGVPFSYIGDLTATPAMGPQLPKNILDLLDECADIDVGTLFEPRAEVGLCYRTLAATYNQGVILDLDYAARHVAPPFEPADDDQQTRNDVRVSRTGGSEARATLDVGRKSTLDPWKGGAGRYDTSLTLNTQVDDQLIDIANWLLWQGTYNDDARYPQISVDLTNADVVTAAKEVAALTVDGDDPLTVSNPFTKQSPNQIRQLARGYSEKIRNFTHFLTFNCAPESPFELLRVGAAGKMKVDNDSSTLTGGPYSSGATSLSVASTGDLWSTTGADYPADVDLAGEVVRVTAVSGAASPQTFTVTRSINGVQKSQANGTAVKLARRATVGL